MLSGCNGFFSCCFEALLNTVYVGAICSTGFALGFVVTALFVYDKNDSILDKDKSDSSSEEEEEEEESELNQFCKKCNESLSMSRIFASFGSLAVTSLFSNA